MVAARLMHDGFVMRDEDAGDFGKPETAFLLCIFLYVNALALAGRRTEQTANSAHSADRRILPHRADRFGYTIA